MCIYMYIYIIHVITIGINHPIITGYELDINPIYICTYMHIWRFLEIGVTPIFIQVMDDHDLILKLYIESV